MFPFRTPRPVVHWGYTVPEIPLSESKYCTLQGNDYIYEKGSICTFFCAALLYPLYRPLSPWVSIVWCHSLRSWRNRIIPQTRPTVKIFIFRVKCTCMYTFHLAHCLIVVYIPVYFVCVCVCSLFLSLFFSFDKKFYIPRPQQWRRNVGKLQLNIKWHYFVCVINRKHLSTIYKWSSICT